MLNRLLIIILFTLILSVFDFEIFKAKQIFNFSWLYSALVVGFVMALMTVDVGEILSGYYIGFNLVIISVNLLTPRQFMRLLING